VLVSSVPLSLTTVSGNPRTATIASSPDSDVSATRPRHSRVQSSTTHSIRNRRPSDRLSDTKSSDHRWFGPSGTAIGARVPKARLRPPRRRTCKRSSAYNRRSFLWFSTTPSRDSSSPRRRYPNRRRSPAKARNRARVAASSGRIERYRTAVRSVPSTRHARRSLTS
jgi:hypothetical protein